MKSLLFTFAVGFLIAIFIVTQLFHFSIFVSSYFVLLSVICFLVYAWDKRQAVRSSDKKVTRVSERTLHFIALLGGWPGALLGQQILRHKSKKRRFIVGLWGTIIVNLALLGCVGYSTISEIK